VRTAPVRRPNDFRTALLTNSYGVRFKSDAVPYEIRTTFRFFPPKNFLALILFGFSLFSQFAHVRVTLALQGGGVYFSHLP